MSAFAFAPPLTASAFTPAARPARATTALAPPRAAAPASRRTVTMLNPFKNRNKDGSDPQAESAFMAPQPGDPGYVAPPPVPKGTGMAKSEPRASEKKKMEADAAAKAAADAEKKKVENKDGASSLKPASKTVTPKTKGGVAGIAAKLPVSGGDVKRGLDLLREDLLKNAPQRAGVGRQDIGAVMKPMAGEPGFKPAAYQTVKVSELGISPFPEDANAVGKVGGIAAVKKAAVEVKAGKKSASDVKKEVLKIQTKTEDKDKVFEVPDYLKPIPEDTPRKGYTWKNYVGR